MNVVISNIIDAFPNCEVSLNELGDAPTFWKRWKDSYRYYIWFWKYNYIHCNTLGKY